MAFVFWLFISHVIQILLMPLIMVGLHRGPLQQSRGRRAAHGRTPSWGHEEPGSINLAVGEYSLVGNKDAEHVRSAVFEAFVKGAARSCDWQRCVALRSPCFKSDGQAHMMVYHRDQKPAGRR
jgi:hypothetical protein